MFDGIWERAAATLDRGVDGMLSDRVRYKHGGEWLGDPTAPDDERTVEAFVVYIDKMPSLENEMDEALGSRTMLKIRRDLLPQPATSDRILHPKLGAGTFKPASGMPQTDGRYWLIEVQETSNP